MDGLYKIPNVWAFIYRFVKTLTVFWQTTLQGEQLGVADVSVMESLRQISTHRYTRE
jgi:hypothetical protein